MTPDSPFRGAANRGGPGWATWVGLGVVATAAAVLSFSALADLAVMCGVPRLLAPLLPVAIDAGAAVACTVWLSRRANEAATRYAAWMTWALLATTVAGNALHSGLVAADLRPVWWVAVVVGAVAPAVLGSVVHLTVLAARTDLSGGRQIAVETSVELPRDDRVGETATTDRQVGDEIVYQTGNRSTDRAAALIAEGAGRRRLAAELQISEHAARELLAERRNGHEVTR